MTGPITRPIRDNRPPRDYYASDDRSRDDGRYNHEYSKREQEPTDWAQRGAWRKAFLAMIPERFRPGASLLMGCTVCLIVLPLYIAGSVEWHANPFLWTPLTASAEDMRKAEARLAALEGDSAVLMRIRISGLQKDLCAGEYQSLRLELDELIEAYRTRTGRLPPAAVPCPARPAQ